MKEMYKDWEITYIEVQVGFGGTKPEFIAKKGDKELTGNSLKNIKKAIDKQKKKSFKKIPCIYKSYNKYDEADITSIFKTTSDGTPKGVYISIKEGTTRKIEGYSSRDLFKNTDANKKLIKEINELTKKINDLEAEKYATTDKLEPIIIGDLV